MSVMVMREQLIQAVDELPTEALPELAIFLGYLRFKISSMPLKSDSSQLATGSAFLLAIAGIGASKENNIAERDEQILAAEVDPVRG
ncbi:MAG: hypothetical protein U0350_30710 [Caldilineaceae bacterium]